jgi:hypothetical protein
MLHILGYIFIGSGFMVRDDRDHPFQKKKASAVPGRLGDPERGD